MSINVLNLGIGVFTVVATSGTTLSYQWYYNNNPISGATSATLTLVNVTTANAGSYYVAVKNAGGTVKSSVATLTLLNTAPSATGDAYTVGENRTLTVSAPGILANDTDPENNPLTAVLESSVSHGTLTLNANGSFTYLPATNYLGSDSFTYRANDGMANSGVATVTLTVLPPPVIASQPGSQTVYSGQEVSFSVGASGAETLAYQWRFNGASVPGATNSSLAWANVQTNRTGNITVVVTNLGGSVTSEVARLVVIDSTFRLMQAWAVQYAGTDDNNDYARAVASDAEGNVYVTGYAKESASGNYDYVTLKYDSAGNLLWRAVYDGGKGDDQAAALALDSAGSAYVTGTSKGNGTSWDYATVKYDKNGTRLWVARYNGTADKEDMANAVAVDASGNVFVTGASTGAENHYNYVTLKYNSAGTQVWLARYIGPGNAEDEATALALDRSGNVYVTGQSKGSGTDFDYATVKYDTNGTQMWVARYNGSGNVADSPVGLSVDATGAVLVTGSSINSSGNADYATVKYDAAGKQLWAALYNGPAGKNDSAAALAVDSAGNVFVTGASAVTDTKADFATVKYSADGQQLWVQRYDLGDDDQATALALDASGDVYVTGKAKASSTGYDIATLKYLSADGTQAASATYNSSGSYNDAPVAIAVDAQYNVYVAGQGFIKLDYVLVKYRPNLLAPVVATLAASSVTLRSAQLNGSVDQQGGFTSYCFQYGTTTNYGLTSTICTLGLETGATPVTAALGDLQPDTVYHYRVVAANNAGMAQGPDVAFRTASPTVSRLVGSAYASGRAMRLTVAGTPGSSITLVCSTNSALPLSQWKVLGQMTEVTPGQYEYHDWPPTGTAQCYYRILPP